MTPRAQELLAMLKARTMQQHEVVAPSVRERIIVEKYDHEQAETPVLVETVETIYLDGVLVNHTVTPHAPPAAGK